MKKEQLSPVKFVALITDQSTAKEPIFFKAMIGGMKMETTRSLWDAAKWDSKLEVNNSLQYTRLGFLPHRVRISLTLD